MKKGIKVFISGLITFLSLEAIASARVLSYTELQKEIEKVNPEAVEARIIGNYVFTDANKLRDQDIMIGALTIPGIGDGKHFTQELYNKMSVNRLLRKINPDTGDYENWSIINNLFGETKITEQTSFDIRYIDYTYLKDTFTVSFNLDGGSFKEKDKTLSVLEDDKIDKTLITGENAPTRSGKKFKAWVKDDGTPWNFETDIVTGNMTLKATWYDEVNTNTLLEEAVKNINNNTVSHGHYYDVSFNKSQKELIFEVFDKNQKNSEIEGTGLIGDIVALVNKENVVSITISGGNGAPVTFEKKDVNNGAGPESNAWKQFGLLLQTLTGKEFKEITLGDLLKLKDLTLKITLKEDTARSQNNNVEESYTIKFNYDAKSTISGTLPENDVKVLQSSYNYVPTEDHYTVTGSNGEYKVSGYVIEQDGVKGFGSSSAKHYFAYSIKLDDNVDKSKVKIKVPKKDSPSSDSDYNIYNGSSLDNGVLTVLMEVEDNEKVKFRDIIIEVDGKPTKIRIDFSELKLKKSSKFTIQSVEDVAAAGTKLGEDFGWKKETGFETKFAIVGDTVTVTGLIPILDLASNGKTPFKEEDLTGYYLPFVIKTEKGDREQNAKLTVQFIHEGEESKTITAESFDGNDVLYILRHLHKDATNKTFKIVVDMDGTGEEYAPYELTFDWNGLKLQEKTEPDVSLTGISETDAAQLKEWGYNSSYNENLKLDPNGSDNSVKLSGTMKEQVVGPKVFGDENASGYYFTFTFQLPKGVTPDKAKIARLNDANLSEVVKKEFKTSEYDSTTNSLTILYQFPKDVDCKNGNSEKCKLYYSVDYDGKGNEYLPTLYTIDYSGVTFKKSSLVNLEPVASTVIQDEEEWQGFTEGEGYKVEFDEEASTFKVTGLITIFDDDSWSGGNPFGTAYDHYLAFKLTKAEVDGSDSSTIVKFLTGGEGYGDTDKITGDDFQSNQSIYVLKYLNPNANSDNKQFTITVDFDGDESHEYEPYTITIDWSGLKFQRESIGNFGNYEVYKSNQETDPVTPEEKELQGYSFDSNTTKDVNVKKEQMEDTYKKAGLEGTIREQTLSTSAGFAQEAGYYVPIQIEYPENDIEGYEEYAKTWTLILNTEGGGTKEYIPTEAEYEQGWVMVLFKINRDGSKVIKYQIDFDGTPKQGKNKGNDNGYDFLPQEYSINYENLNFATENKITFEYFDETTGTVKSESKIVYEGDNIGTSIAPNLEEYTYHKFDYWYDSEESSSNGVDLSTLTTEKDEDITLKAHYTLDMDKFLVDVVDDLKSTNTDFSADFTSLFDVKKENNTITFTILDSTAKLSDMNTTSIPGTIAYILQRGEVKDITLMFKGKQVIFKKDEVSGVQSISLEPAIDSLKEKVQAGAKALFKEVLPDEETMTLNKMAVAGETFTLKIGTLDDTVKLDDDAQTEYTFKFETEVTGVINEDELKLALNNNNIKHIDILNDFDVKSTIDINREVVINGGQDYHKLTASSVDTIFDVKSHNVTIDAIKLASAKIPIVVTSGDLKTTGLTVEGENTQVAIEVKDGASLKVSQLTYEGENYEKPAVRTGKSNAIVDFTDSENKTAAKLTEVEKITKYESQGNSKSNLGDTKEINNEYGYYNYYNKAVNSKIYTTTFHNHEARMMATFYRYNYYGEKVQQPNGDAPFKVFKTFNYDGETYTLIGFVTSRDKTIHTSYDGESPLPEGVIKPDAIEATADNYYYAAYSVKLKDGVTKVDNKEALKNAINNTDVSEIYINTTDTMDLSDIDITISRKLSIIGPSQKVTLKAKSINVTADDVFLHRLNIEVDAQPSAEALININNDSSKFTLWQCSLKNVSTSNHVKNAIKYSGTKASVDVRWNTFLADNIDDTYLNVDTALAEVTDIYGNTFKKLTGDTSKKSAIKIKNFDTSAKIKGEDETIRIAANTFDSEDYAIEISKDASDGSQADISLETSQNIEIAVRYNESSKNFGNIKLHYSKNKNMVKITYIDESGNTSEKLENGTGITIVVPVEM